jgi:hypothetical protein
MAHGIQFSVEDAMLMVAALNRAIARLESEARYAQSGKGANNPKTVMGKARKMKKLRDRLLQHHPDK